MPGRRTPGPTAGSGVVPGAARAARSADDRFGAGLQRVDLAVQVVDLQAEHQGDDDGRGGHEPGAGRPPRDRRRAVPIGTTAADAVAGRRDGGPVRSPVRRSRLPGAPAGTSSRAARRSQDSSDVPPRRPAMPSHSSAGGGPPELASSPATSWCWATSSGAPHAFLEVRLDDGGRLGVHGVERVGAQQLLDLGVAQRLRRRAHSSAPAGSTPRSARLTRSRPRPDRIRLLTVPSGSSSSTATSW